MIRLLEYGKRVRELATVTAQIEVILERPGALARERAGQITRELAIIRALDHATRGLD